MQTQELRCKMPTPPLSCSHSVPAEANLCDVVLSICVGTKEGNHADSGIRVQGAHFFRLLASFTAWAAFTGRLSCFLTNEYSQVYGAGAVQGGMLFFGVRCVCFWNHCVGGFHKVRAALVVDCAMFLRL